MHTDTNTIAPVDTPVAIVVTDRPNPLAPAEPATGRTDVVVYLSDTQGGDPINEDVELTADETDTLGTYLATFQGEDLLAILPSRAHGYVWRCIRIGTHLIAAERLFVVATL